MTSPKPESRIVSIERPKSTFCEDGKVIPGWVEAGREALDDELDPRAEASAAGINPDLTAF